MLAPHRLVSLAAPLLLATLQFHCTSDSGFQCSSDANDCGEAGLCEPTGFCSFDDPGCPSGRRYGDLAEALSNQCVPLEMGTDSPGTSTSSGSTGPVVGTTDADASGESTSSASAGFTTVITGPTGGSDEGTGGSTGGSTSSDETTGGSLLCQLETFDVLPGKPGWFEFGDVDVADGELVLNVDPPSESLAGLRTATPLDLTTGSVTAVISAYPELAAATSSFALADEVFNSENGYDFGVLNGVLRLERTTNGGNPVVLQSASLEAADFPLTLRFEILDSEIHMTANATEGDRPLLTWTEEPLEWVDDLYVTLNAGNPTENPTVGNFLVDSLELCPPLNP